MTDSRGMVELESARLSVSRSGRLRHANSSLRELPISTISGAVADDPRQSISWPPPFEKSSSSVSSLMSASFLSTAATLMLKARGGPNLCPANQKCHTDSYLPGFKGALNWKLSSPSCPGWSCGRAWLAVGQVNPSEEKLLSTLASSPQVVHPRLTIATLAFRVCPGCPTRVGLPLGRSRAPGKSSEPLCWLPGTTTSGHLWRGWQVTTGIECSSWTVRACSPSTAFLQFSSSSLSLISFFGLPFFAFLSSFVFFSSFTFGAFLSFLSVSLMAWSCSALLEEDREVFLPFCSWWFFFSIFMATFTTLSVFLIKDFFSFFSSLLSIDSSPNSIVIRSASVFTFFTLILSLRTFLAKSLSSTLASALRSSRQTRW